MSRRWVVFVLAGMLLTLAALPAGAAPRAGPCVPGITYDSGCDVDHDGDVDIVDIGLIAGHFGRSGTWVGGTTWSLTGNAATVPGPNFLGTTDNQAVHIRVNNTRALLIQPTASGSPNIVAGYALNDVSSNVVGATISGGGGPTNVTTNHVGDNFGVVVGGASNRAGDYDGVPTDAQYAVVTGGGANTATSQGATVSGGDDNDATGNQATVRGGRENWASAERSTVAGGYNNTATGVNASIGGGALHFASGDNARIAGGSDNTTAGQNPTVGGGLANEATATGSSVGGGSGNWAYAGSYGTIPGGSTNTASGAYSLAIGYRAKATSQGSLVWADPSGTDFTSTGTNTLRVRSTGGSEFDANNGSYGMSVNNAGTGNGLQTYASTSEGTNWAALFASNGGTSPGLYAISGGTYAAYFADPISVNGGCTGCDLLVIAINASAEVIQPSDVVAAAGMHSPLAGSGTPVLRIRAADARGALGVADRRLAITRSQHAGQAFDSPQAIDGAIQPGDYLLVVAQGLAQVRVASGESFSPGQRLTVAEAAGRARAVRDVEPRGFDTPIVGIALDAPNPTTGLVPVLVTAHAN